MATKTACSLLATANVTLTAPEAETLGGTRISYGARSLMVGQSTARQNGIYAASESTQAMTGSESYDGTGEYTVTGLSTGDVYSWRKGVNGLTLVNGTETLTESGWFLAQDDEVLLTGTPSEDVVDYVANAAWTRAADANDAADWAEAWTVQAAGIWYQWTLVAPFTLGSTAVTISMLVTTPSAPWDADSTDPETTPGTPWDPAAPGTPAPSLVSLTPLSVSPVRRERVLAGGIYAPEAGTANLGTASAKHILGTGTGTRVQRDMDYIDQVKFWVGSLTSVTGVRLTVFRFSNPNMLLVGQSENLLSRLTGSAINTVRLCQPIPQPRIGDYLCLSITASGSVTFLRTVTATDQSLWVVDSASTAEGTISVGQGSFVASTALPLQVYGPPADLLGAGDSIMSGELASACLRSGKTDAAYTGLDMLAGLRAAGWSVANMGIGGQTSTQLLSRWQADVVEQRPLALVVHIGGNDIGNVSTLAELPAAKATIIANFETMLDYCAAAGVRIVVLGICPRSAWCTAPLYAISQARREINTTLRSIVATRYRGQAAYIDPDALIGANYAPGDAGNLDALAVANNGGDDVHLSAAGQAALSTEIAAVFDQWIL
jgi:lysophospholipase L1-like esterase/flavin-binding protein dodecin